MPLAFLQPPATDCRGALLRDPQAHHFCLWKLNFHCWCVNRGRGGGRGGGRGDKGKGDTAAHIYKIVKMIKDRNFEPVIVFSFSRRCVSSETPSTRLCKFSKMSL